MKLRYESARGEACECGCNEIAMVVMDGLEEIQHNEAGPAIDAAYGVYWRLGDEEIFGKDK